MAALIEQRASVEPWEPDGAARAAPQALGQDRAGHCDPPLTHIRQYENGPTSVSSGSTRIVPQPEHATSVIGHLQPRLMAQVTCPSLLVYHFHLSLTQPHDVVARTARLPVPHHRFLHGKRLAQVTLE